MVHFEIKLLVSINILHNIEIHKVFSTVPYHMKEEQAVLE